MPKHRVLRILLPDSDFGERRPEEVFHELLVQLGKSFQNKKFSLEVIGYHQSVSLCIVTPEEIARRLENHFYAVYPNAEVQYIEDYARKPDPSLHIACASIYLENADAYPIRTFDKIEGQQIAPLFTSLARVDTGDQLWLQFIVEPREVNLPYIFRRMLRLQWDTLKTVLNAFNYFKPGGPGVILRKRTERAAEKAKEDPFKVSIRCAYLSVEEKSLRDKLRTFLAAFEALCEDEGDVNGFMHKRASNDAFLSMYRNRSFGTPSFTLIAKEIATVYHAPNPKVFPSIARILAKKSQMPAQVPRFVQGEESRDLLSLGVSNYRNSNVPFALSRADRRRHLYIVGKAAMGKSLMLKVLISRDLQAGESMLVIDPHGETVESALCYVPAARRGGVVFFDPTDTAYPIGFNPLDGVDEDRKDRRAQAIMNAFIQLGKDKFGDPNLLHVVRSAIFALLYAPELTLLALPRFLTDPKLRLSIIPKIQDPFVRQFWEKEFGKTECGASGIFLNLFREIVASPSMRNILGQEKTSFSFDSIVRERGALLARLPLEQLGTSNAKFLGMLLLQRCLESVTARNPSDRNSRDDICVYVDEFQNFFGDDLATMLLEMQKYDCSFILSNQYLNQLADEHKKSIFGSVGSFVCFQAAAEDAEFLLKVVQPVFEVKDLLQLQKNEFYARLSHSGENTLPFSGRNFDLPQETSSRPEDVVAASRSNYSARRAKI